MRASAEVVQRLMVALTCERAVRAGMPDTCKRTNHGINWTDRGCGYATMLADAAIEEHERLRQFADQQPVVTHAAYPSDADGMGFMHTGPVWECDEPECRPFRDLGFG